MSNLIANKELASKYLDVALKYDELEEFLTGDLMYELTIRDTYGNKFFSAMHVMEAIYEKHISNPSLHLDKMTYDTIIQVLEESCYSKDILNIFSDIEYQINSQMNNRAAFNFDCTNLLLKVKENISRNAEIYKTPEDKDHPNGIWSDIEKHGATLEQITGKKVM